MVPDMVAFSLLIAFIAFTSTDAFNLLENVVIGPENTPGFGFAMDTTYNEDSKFIVTAIANKTGQALLCTIDPPSCTKDFMKSNNHDHHFFGLSASGGASIYVVSSARMSCWKRETDEEAICSNEESTKQYCAVGVLRQENEDKLIIQGRPGTYDSSASNLNSYSNLYSKPMMKSTFVWNNNQNYIGYSIHTGGDFNSDGMKDVAAGAPRFGNGLDSFFVGAVEVYLGSGTSVSTTPTFTLIGSQHGDYFGSSLCVGDFNGDKKDDLCVGAPLFINNGRRDVGQVSCYFNSGSSIQVQPQLIDGTHVGEQFGFSLISGDFDGDDNADLIVGAPYFGRTPGTTNYRGRIVVYNGQAAGLKVSHSQIIEGKFVTSRFGYSLAAFSKIDHPGVKKRPKVLISALKEEKVYVYESLNVADLTVVITTNLQGDILTLDTTFFTYTITFKNPSDYDIPSGGINYEVVLDDRISTDETDKLKGLVPGISSNNGIQNIDINVKVSLPTSLSFKEAYSTPVDMTTTWSNESPSVFALRYRVMTANKVLDFSTGCTNGICNTVLEMELTSEDGINLVVPKSRVEYEATVLNLGPDIALSTSVTIDADTLEIVEFPNDYCKLDRKVILFCDLGDLESSKSHSIIFTVDSTELLASGEVTIEASATTRSILDNPELATKNISLGSILYSDAAITGQSDDKPVTSKIVPNRVPIEHVYSIAQTYVGYELNALRPPVRNISVEIYWPYGLLYPIDIEFKGGLCDVDYIDCSGKQLKYDGFSNSTEKECDFGIRPPCQLEQAKFPTYVPDNSTDEESNIVTCKNWEEIYVSIKCHMDILSENDIGLITILSVPNTDFLANETFNENGYTWAPSFAKMTVTSEDTLPGNSKDEAYRNNFDGTFTMLSPIGSVIVVLEPGKKGKTPLWLIIVPIVVGLLLVLLALFALSKLGFFQRKKPPSSESASLQGDDDADEAGPEGEA